MLLIVATPMLPSVIEKYRIVVLLSRREHDIMWQSALDGYSRATRRLDIFHVANTDRWIGSVENGDTPSVIILGRIRFLILDHVHRAPPGRPFILDSCAENGIGVGCLTTRFWVENSSKFGTDGATTAGAAEPVI